ADRRFRPSRRGCRSQWRGLPTGNRDTDSAGAFSTVLVVASSCRIRSSDRRELLMARAKKATEAPIDRLDAMLARLQLSGIRDQLDSLLDEAARANLSARETLILLCEREIARKDHRRIEMGLKLAHFPAVKELTGFDFEAQPSIDPKQIRDLAASRWIANGENVLLLGPPGVGKTHLSIALGREAILAGYTVQFTTATTLVAGLTKAHGERRLDETLLALATPKLLIVDELGSCPAGARRGAPVFQLVSRRYETGAMLITSNRSVAEWAPPTP